MTYNPRSSIQHPAREPHRLLLPGEQDRAADHMEHTHTFSISPAHLDVMSATAAKCGYRMTVLDPGKFKKNGKAYKRATVRFTREPEVDLPLIVKTRTVSREDLVKEQTLKERMEARACPSCGSWAVATRITMGAVADPVRCCQACGVTWPMPSKKETNDG